jgi:hypothetical protein
MAVHVEEMSAQVTVLDGDLPLTEAQLDRIAALVVVRLQELERGRKEEREDRMLTGSAAPSLGVEA